MKKKIFYAKLKKVLILLAYLQSIRFSAHYEHTIFNFVLDKIQFCVRDMNDLC